MAMSRSRTPAKENSDHASLANSQYSEYGHLPDEISPILAMADGDLPPTQMADEDDDEPEFKIKKRKQSAISDTSTLVDEPASKRVKHGREPYIIASAPVIEARMRDADTASGVALECARLKTLGKITYQDITTERLQSLTGPNADAAPRTSSVFQPSSNVETSAPDSAFARENSATSPWEELDREEANLAKDPYSGLGHSPFSPGWYGGKVSFAGKLKSTRANSNNEPPNFDVVLDRCSLGPSSRFTRRFGSTSILRIRIDGDNLFRFPNALQEFFKKPFILWGRVYRSFYAKEGSVFLFRTNEGFVGGDVFPSMFPGFSFLEFMHWHNPLETNQKQGMPKWSARMALGLSNSFPGPLLLQENIQETDDVVAPDTQDDAPGRDMTDGCGYSNRSTHLQVYHMLGPDSYPSAFQYRLAGIKGMSSERSDLPFTDPQKIWFRPSQRKIKYPENHHPPEDPTLRIIELVRTSHMKTPGRLSAELTINLAENGVPAKCFKDLLRSQLEETLKSLTTWEGPDAMYNLWVHVERIGAVLFARRAREAAGEARAKGYGEQLDDDGREEEDDDDDDLLSRAGLGQRSTAWWPDHVSGCPSSLEETVLVLLDAGFLPTASPILREKLKNIAKSRINNTLQKVNWDLPHSATAFVIPDEYGVLGENEVQIKSSRRNLLLPGAEKVYSDTILGDVLLSRNPTKLPTDVRKLKAVEHPALRDCVDVIVCSVKGQRRLLDFLAGGDYDGDKVIAIWAPEFVENFRNAPDKHSLESEGVKACFETTHNIKVGEFAEAIKGSTETEAIAEYQKYLLGALRNPAIIGLSSKMHDVAVYKHGYAHNRAVKLAHIFCKVLDGGKSGLTWKEHSYQEHKKTYLNGPGPKWKQKNVDPTRPDTSNINPLDAKFRKEQGLPRFIMDELNHTAEKQGEEMLAQINDVVFKDLRISQLSDSDLCKPWNDAKNSITEGRGSKEIQEAKQRDLKKIEKHVEYMFKQHQERVNTQFSNKHIEVRQDVLRALSKQFVSSPKLEDMETIMDEASITRLRASCAYVYDRKAKDGRWSRFPWNVALRELCHIKASALGPHKTTTIGFYERFKLSMRR